MLSQTITIYVGCDGKAHSASESHVKLFSTLRKLGIRSTPDSELAVYTVTAPAGNYLVSHDASGVITISSVYIPCNVDIQLDKKISHLERVAKKRRTRGADDNTRSSWADVSRRHGRNTGRQ